jgi:hypothetical protein
MDAAVEQPVRASCVELRDHMVGAVTGATLERNPFCHIYMEGIFPSAFYQSMLGNLPSPSEYVPLNLRLYSRKNGESTRDLFHLTTENLAKLPLHAAGVWTELVRAVTHPFFKQAVFRKLAPDLAERFGTEERAVPDIDCAYEVVLFRDTDDYRIKPHPDGLNKIVTMQFYLPEDESFIDLGTSLYRSSNGLLGKSFHEVKRFPFKPNSAYAFAVSDSRVRRSWHGRDRLTAFSGARNTLMVLFQQKSPREYRI